MRLSGDDKKESAMAKTATSRAMAKAKKKEGKSPPPIPVGTLTQATIEDVSLGDVALDDVTFQYRVLPIWDDVKTALERDGQLEPVDLFAPKPYRIIDGYRRVHAASELGWSSIKAFVYRDISEEQAHRIAFSKNVVRRNLSPLERANAIYQARRRGRTIEAVATDFGLSNKQIHRYEELLTFPKGLQGLVDDHNLSMAHATLIAACSVVEIVDWAEKVQLQHWSASDLRRELRKSRGRTTSPKIQQYLKINGDLLQLSKIRVRKTAASADKAAVVAALEQAISFLSS
jgi:ParB/RepB/Spo0J family partition protein